MRPLTVLFTNVTLASRSGTELYIKEVVRELVRRGHRPIVYSPDCGEIAAEIREMSVPVVDDITLIRERPDVIHAHHSHQAIVALLTFPTVPVVFVVHDWSAWHDRPPLFDGISRYVAVDWTVRDRLTMEAGVDAARVEVIGNWADTTRFVPRGSLPPRPERAIVYSNYVSRDGILPAIEEACRNTGVELHSAGLNLAGTVREPEQLLGHFDIVFAKAKSAMEALAAGCSVILCDAWGLGGMVTSAELDRLLRFNLGRRLLTRKVTSQALVSEMAKYDAGDAEVVSARIRSERSVERGVDSLVDLYARVVEEGRAEESDPFALVRYLQSWSGWIHPLKAHLAAVDAERQRLHHLLNVQVHDRRVMGGLKAGLVRMKKTLDRG